MADSIDEIEEVEAIEEAPQSGANSDPEGILLEEDSRTPRSLDCRDESKREEPWPPATLLPSPDPVDGFTFRWVRVAMRGEPDNQNVSRKLREGWVPVKLEDYPELQVIPDVDSRFKGNIVVGGLMLCKNSKERMAAKRAYHDKQAQAQMEAVDSNYMRENDARMPMLQSERKTRVTFGDGS